ncbi:MAG: hypothetical protein H0V44_00100 [Planctomycetes bacterium]|nr:hypothetical protein [Planctomycetota bacterium]
MRALATGAGVLLLDEPTSSLDVAHRLSLAGLIRRLAASGKAIPIALHDLSEASEVATQVVLLHRGAVLHAGRPRRT